MLGSNGTVLTDITPRAGPETVYNFEVAGEHVYYVGTDGLLVHNACTDIEKALRNWGKRVKNPNKPGYRKVRSAKRLDGDHRLPRSVIEEVMGKSKVGFKKQRKILEIMDGKKNLRPMEKSLNRSKGNRNMKDWGKTKQGKETTGPYRNGIHKTQRSVADDINSVINGGVKGPDWFKDFF